MALSLYVLMFDKWWGHVCLSWPKSVGFFAIGVSQYLAKAGGGCPFLNVCVILGPHCVGHGFDYIETFMFPRKVAILDIWWYAMFTGGNVHIMYDKCSSDILVILVSMWCWTWVWLEKIYATRKWVFLDTWFCILINFLAKSVFWIKGSFFQPECDPNLSNLFVLNESCSGLILVDMIWHYKHYINRFYLGQAHSLFMG